MSNFTLPPPPPPPPKAAAEVDSAHYQGTNVRGNRGFFRGRGRASNPRALHRGGNFRNVNQYRGNSERYPGGHSSNTTHYNYRAQANTTASSASFESQLDKAAYSPSQNLYGFPEHLPNGPLPQSSIGAATTKRKRDGHEQQTLRPQSLFQTKSRPINRPKVDVAPAVPSFGFSLPLQAPTPSAIEKPNSTALPHAKVEQQTTKRKSNQLGLTPQGDLLDEDDEDVDEEAVHAAYTGPLRVEYNGAVIELSSAEALKQWIEERKKKWPTKARVEEKKKLALKEKQDALRKRLEADQAKKRDLEERTRGREERKRKENELEKDAKDRKALEKHLAKASKLRKKLGIAPSESEAITSTLPGLDRDIVKDLEAAKTNADTSKSPPKLSHPSSSPKAEDEEPAADDISISSEGDSSGSDSSSISDSTSSTNGPQQTSSKADGPVRVPPPKREPSQRNCQEFAMRGKCHRGTRCFFKHDTDVKAMRPKQDLKRQPISTQRKSLYQRLVEQEQEAETRLALQAICYLGHNGLFEDT